MGCAQTAWSPVQQRSRTLGDPMGQKVFDHVSWTPGSCRSYCSHSPCRRGVLLSVTQTMSQAPGILARLHPHSYLTIARYAPPHSYLIAQPTIRGATWPLLTLFSPHLSYSLAFLFSFPRPPPCGHGQPLFLPSLSPCLSTIKL